MASPCREPALCQLYRHTFVLRRTRTPGYTPGRADGGGRKHNGRGSSGGGQRGKDRNVDTPGPPETETATALRRLTLPNQSTVTSPGLAAMHGRP